MYEDSPNISISTGEETEEETPPPTENPIDGVIDALQRTASLENAHANCLATNAELRAQIDTLRNDQIMGDDYRLTDFWEKAQELADRAGHCSVYDEIAEALGGPAREREYDVTVTYSATWTVSARDEQSAIDYATEAIEDAYTIGDLNVESTYAEES